MSKWTREKPTEPGTYWIRFYLDTAGSTVEAIATLSATEGGLWIYWAGSNNAVFLDDWDIQTEWQGPLQPDE